MSLYVALALAVSVWALIALAYYLEGAVRAADYR
jgi:hypothetical protein